MAETAETSAPEASTTPRIPPGLGRTRDLLIAKPELLRGDESLMQALGVRPIAANVVDFGPAALSRLERAYSRESAARQEIEDVARANYDAQTQTHAAVLDLLKARNNADLAQRLAAVGQTRFGLCATALLVESAPLSGWGRMEPGDVDALLGPEGERRLGPLEDPQALFGPEAGPVGSAALVRLRLWRSEHPGLLALGAENPEVFAPDMGGELVAFLARVVERMADRWPPLL